MLKSENASDFIYNRSAVNFQICIYLFYLFAIYKIGVVKK